MGKAYRLVRPQLTVQDVMDIKSNPKLRLTTSPFGLTPQEYETNAPVYIGKAVNWKGTKGPRGGGMTKAFIDKAPAAVVSGLRAAIAISKSCAGIKGTTLWNGRVYPRKCIEQKKKAGKGA